MPRYLYITRVTGAGDIEFVRRIGGAADDRATAIARTADGGYVLLGESTETIGAGRSDLLIIKLSPALEAPCRETPVSPTVRADVGTSGIGGTAMPLVITERTVTSSPRDLGITTPICPAP
jgi:hypothetical protein